VSIEQRLVDWLRQGMVAAAPAIGLDPAELPTPEVLAPRQKEHGDFATNVALMLAKPAGRAPRDVAQAIADALPPVPFVRKVEVAGPGFLNVFTTEDWLYETLREIVGLGEAYGRAAPTGRRVQVEFVSANPTGPLHVGHARNAALGDALARILEASGESVEREYYFNDAGRQMELLDRSVDARYRQVTGRDAVMPEDGYQGAYLEEIVREVVDEHGPSDLPDDRVPSLVKDRILDGIKATLDRFNVRFDVYFSEAELERKGEIADAVQRLRDRGFAYDDEGAVWFRSTAFGDDKDRVLIRSNGSHTYFGADCAYLLDKFSRGFDHVVYVWGADHHGDIARVKGAATALGLDADAVEIVLYQFVSFMREGEVVPMSKRAGHIVTLDELIDEVGADAARFTLLSSSNDSAMNFDIEVVKQQTMENPVYYVQYGHARLASILRTAAERGIAMPPIDDVDLGVLTHDAELALLRALAEVPGAIADAAELRAPHRLTHAVQDLAARSHRFYTECRVMSEDEALTHARLWLCVGCKRVIANLLGLLGVSAPESMARVDAPADAVDDD
jgi:arginyl-tRNA synthetase